MDLAAQDPPRHGRPRPSSAQRRRRGRRDPRRRPQARQTRPRCRRQDGRRRRDRGRRRRDQKARARPAAARGVASAASADLERFITANVAERAAITTDGWRGYGRLEAAGYDHHAIDLARSWGEADQRLPAVHLVFGLAKRWLLGTHHGAVGAKYVQRYLDEFVFRFNRRRAKSPAHGFARVLQNAVRIPPATHREIVAAGAT